MTKIKYILLSSLLLIELSCKEQTLEIELQPLTVKLLEQFSLEQKSYLDTLAFYNEPVFYSLAVDKVKDETRIQMYLIENNLDVYVEDFKAHSKFNSYDVVIYGDLNSLFYKIDKSNKSTYVHKYGSYQGLYDPPYWNLYFDKNGKLMKTSPKDVFDRIEMDKAK